MAGLSAPRTRPYVSLRGTPFPLRADVAAEVRAWIAEKAALEAAEGPDVVSFPSGGRKASGAAGGVPGAVGLPADTRLFNVPEKLVKILNRDLEAAGIPKRDEWGRTVDVHSLRHTFGTWLSTSGVSPRVAMEAMRHSKLELTMGVYTDPRLLDVAGAVEAQATGTEGRAGTAPPARPLLRPPAVGRGGQSVAPSGNSPPEIPGQRREAPIAANPLRGNEKGPLSLTDNGPLGSGRYWTRTNDPQLVELVL